MQTQDMEDGDEEGVKGVPRQLNMAFQDNILRQSITVMPPEANHMSRYGINTQPYIVLSSFAPSYRAIIWRILLVLKILFEPRCDIYVVILVTGAHLLTPKPGYLLGCYTILSLGLELFKGYMG